MRFQAMILSAGILVLLILSACSSDSDAGNIAKELADRLTDALDFDGGDVVDELPPDEHAGDNAYPQMQAVSGPNSLAEGASFVLTLTGASDATEMISGAALYVEPADKHIRVEKSAGADGVLELTATFTGGSELQGEEFSIKCALLDADGLAGNYLVWETSVPKENNEESYNCEENGFDCTDERADQVNAEFENAFNVCEPGCADQPDACVCACYTDYFDAVTQVEHEECFGCLRYAEGISDTPETARQEAAEGWVGLQDVVDVVCQEEAAR